MVVDIVVKRDRSYKVIVKGKVGPYSGDNNLRPEFRELVSWARTNKMRTGCWLFYELDRPETPTNRRRWEACLEIKDVLGKKAVELPQGVSFRKIPSQLVASVTFDPDKFSSRLVYHGLECWLEWGAKYGELREEGPAREIYIDDPWTNPKAWANAQVQVRVVRIGK